MVSTLNASVLLSTRENDAKAKEKSLVVVHHVRTVARARKLQIGLSSACVVQDLEVLFAKWLLIVADPIGAKTVERALAKNQVIT